MTHGVRPVTVRLTSLRWSYGDPPKPRRKRKPDTTTATTATTPGSSTAGQDERRQSERVNLWAPRLIALATLVLGGAAAIYYSRADLALAHYDARAHLVVARRILDSLMPGWQQVGAVWLPLPHVLNMVPVQVDAWYRTGASAIAISVMSMAAGAWALSSTIVRRTGSVVAGAAGAALLLANPNVLYLQSTPMTEPLLFGTTLVAMALTADWLDRGAPARPRAAGFALVAACMTRYEAWPICGALVLLSLGVLLRRGTPLGSAARAVAGLAAYPVLAVVLFLLNSRWTVGRVVRQQRLLRRGKRSARSAAARLGSGS